ncbi:MAG: hypothetical protein GWO22_40715, partial [Actinobacteria bacterium]|nr:hypothetical protein [Actinomycetota bacterium]NIV59321.1 hypothetical protein [Actinomycetota bacterium]
MAVALAAPGAVNGAIQLYDLDLTTAGLCNPGAELASCARYGGDTARYPSGTSFRIEADFDAALGDLVPLVLPDFFVPDPSAFPDPIPIAAPGEGNGLMTTGTWNTATGEILVDAAPMQFDVIAGGVLVDPVDLTTENLAALLCSTTIPAMSGSRPVGPTSAPGDVTLVGRVCVTGPSLNEPFLIIVRGTMSPVVVPGACGDRVLNTGEECDDGNMVSGDGCSSVC